MGPPPQGCMNPGRDNKAHKSEMQTMAELHVVI
jgi:hypothetical protein